MIPDDENPFSVLVVNPDTEECGFYLNILTLLGVAKTASAPDNQEGSDMLSAMGWDVVVFKLVEDFDDLLGKIFSQPERPMLIVTYDDPELLCRFDAQAQTYGLTVAGRLRTPLALSDMGSQILTVRERYRGQHRREVEVTRPVLLPGKLG